MAAEEGDPFDRVGRAYERVVPSLLWPFPLLGAGLTVWVGLHLAVQASVNAQIGFDYATPQVSWHEEVFLITRIVPGRPMALAGVEEGDRVRFDDVSHLYAALICHQGGVAHIPITSHGQDRDAAVHVPPMKLPFSTGFRKWLYGKCASRGT